MSTVPHAAVDPGRRSDAPPALLELRGVGKHFAGADRPALDGADLTVHEGDFIAIVGPSGSGKSTLLNVLGLLDRPDAGAYLVDGKDTTAMGEAERDRLRSRVFGFVFQSSHVLGDEAVSTNAALGLRIQRVPWDERDVRAGEALDLLGLGHREVHHVTGPQDSQSALIRKATWARTLREAGREVPEPVPGDWEAAAGYEAGLRLAADPEVTAVFCANDELALGLIRAMHEQGRRVPSDVSVVGFDGIDWVAHLPVPLSTVRQPKRDLGSAAARVLMALIAGQPVASSTVLEPQLVLRKSSGPAPA